MLIQRGKAEGWLHLDVNQTQEWARLSGISFSAASATRIPGRGIGLTAGRDLTAPVEILSVDQDLVLSLGTIKQHAQFDSDFREVFDSLGASATVGAPLHFILLHSLCACTASQTHRGGMRRLEGIKTPRITVNSAEGDWQHTIER
jgi:hypothetical protein